MKTVLVLMSALMMSNVALADKPNFMKHYNPANNPINQPAPVQEINPELKSNSSKYGRECIYDEKTMWKENKEKSTVSIFLGAWGKGMIEMPDGKVMGGELIIQGNKYQKGALKENYDQYEICKLPD